MITAELLGAEAMMTRLASIGKPSIVSSVTRGMNLFLIKAQTTVKTVKLNRSGESHSGPGDTEVLHHHTGKLSRSVHHGVAQEPGFLVGTLAAGKEVPYARIHEYGAFLGRFVHLAWGKEMSNPRIVTFMYPERSFIRSTIREMTPAFNPMIREAVQSALQGRA